MREPTAEQFLKEVSNHGMNVARNDGIYRHVRFRQAKNSHLWFDLVTWPGYLTISGDMGTWTFSRTPDMFTFFREHAGRPLSDRSINPSYWAEKLQHGNYTGRDGAKVWDEDDFRKQIIDDLDHYDFTPEQLEEAKEAVEGDILCHDGKWAMMTAAYEFSAEISGYGKLYFEGESIPSGMVYSYHFLWCLYAIVWGIHKFDHGSLALMGAETEVQG